MMAETELRRLNRGAIVLAGGKSSRMGRDKWRIELGGRTVLERIADELRGKVDALTVVLPFDAAAATLREVEASLGARAIRDETAGGGPLAGIAAGLRAFAGDAALVAAADMPFVRWPLAAALFAACEAPGVDCALPVVAGRAHPLFAAYRRDVLASLDAYYRDDGRKVTEWVGRLRAATLDEAALARVGADETALFNMNAPEHVEIAERMLYTEGQ